MHLLFPIERCRAINYTNSRSCDLLLTTNHSLSQMHRESTVYKPNNSTHTHSGSNVERGWGKIKRFIGGYRAVTSVSNSRLLKATAQEDGRRGSLAADSWQDKAGLFFLPSLSLPLTLLRPAIICRPRIKDLLGCRARCQPGNPNQVRETLSSSSAATTTFLPSVPLFLPPLPTRCASLSRTKIAAALFRLLARSFSVSPCTRSCTPRLRSCSSILLRAARRSFRFFQWRSFNGRYNEHPLRGPPCAAEGLAGKWTAERIEPTSDFLLSYSAKQISRK